MEKFQQSELNEFNMDVYRTQLVLNNNIEKLKSTYSGEYPSLKETDSSLKWDKHALYNNTLMNPITINRINTIARLTFKYKNKDKKETKILD